MRTIENEQIMPVISELVKEGKRIRLTVSGSSMAPFLVHQRDSVIIERPREAFRTGDIVFYLRTNGQYVMHRIHHIDRDGRLYIIGDAQTEIEGPVEVSAVFGIIRKANRKGKWTRPGDFWWEFFARVWIHMIPVRRLILRIYAIL
jgi:SOS-response transcriptional repressor LexA